MESIGIAAVLDDRNFQQGLSRFTKGLSTMESGATSTANVLSSIGKIASGALVVGIGAATAAIGGLVAASKVGLDSALSYAEGLDDLGNKFGLTGQDAAKWTQAFNHVGLSVEEGTMGLNTLTRGLLDTAEALKDPKAKPTAFAEALGKLGVKAVDAKGKVKSFNAVMPEIMDGFKKLPKGIEKTNLAMSIFGGRGGSKFLEFLDQGSEGLAKAEALVKQYGLALTDAQVEALDDFSKAQNDINAAFKGMQVQIGIAVLPIVKRLSDYFSTNVVPVFNKFVQDTLPKLVAGFDKFVAFLQINVLPIVDRFRQAFDKGGIGGIIDQLGIELTKAFKGFDLAKILGGLGASLSTAWAKTIQPELAKWGGQFWGWLTDPATGVISQIATKFGEFNTALVEWIKNGGGKESLKKAGKDIGETIGNGIIELLKAPTTAGKMVDGLDGSVDTNKNGFVLIGENIGGGIIEGISNKLGERGAEINWGDVIKIVGIGSGVGLGLKLLPFLPGLLTKAAMSLFVVPLATAMQAVFDAKVLDPLAKMIFKGFKFDLAEKVVAQGALNPFGAVMAALGGIDIGATIALWMIPWTNNFVIPFQKSIDDIFAKVPLVNSVWQAFSNLWLMLAGGVLIVSGVINVLKQLAWIGWDVIIRNVDNARKAFDNLEDSFANVKAGIYAIFLGADNIVWAIKNGLAQATQALLGFEKEVGRIWFNVQQLFGFIDRSVPRPSRDTSGVGASARGNTTQSNTLSGFAQGGVGIARAGELFRADAGEGFWFSGKNWNVPPPSNVGSIAQPVLTTNNTNSRSVSVSFAPGSMAFSGASAGDVENIAQTIANRTVAAILATA